MLLRNIDVFRVPVMEEVPDHINAVLAAGLDEWVDRTKVILTVPVDQRPAHGFARRRNADITQPLVIFIDMFVMMRGAKSGRSTLPGVVASGAFKSRKEKSYETCAILSSWTPANWPTRSQPPATRRRYSSARFCFDTVQLRVEVHRPICLR